MNGRTSRCGYHLEEHQRPTSRFYIDWTPQSLNERGTPSAIIDRGNVAIDKALVQPEIKTRLANLGCDTAPGTTDNPSARIQNDVTRWKKLAIEKQIRAD